MSKQRLAIINRRKSLKHHKQWYKGKKRRLKDLERQIIIQEFRPIFGLNVVEEISDLLIKEITTKEN